MPDTGTAVRLTTRRDFLALSRQLLLGATAIALSPLNINAQTVAALNFQALDQESVGLLTQACRLLFPHDGLPQAVYLEAAREVDRRMKANPEFAAAATQAVAFLGSATPVPWQQATVAQQLAALTAGQDSAWFPPLRDAAMESLYRNPQVWQLVGYQGSSIEHGGYLQRGFDDIDWLDR
jgi:hypothetical protein